MMMQFYTYLHCKPDGTPFYVGKGMGLRAMDLADRNQHHKNVVSKYGKDNIDIFIFPRASEQEAFDTEIRWIAQFKREGIKLANKTNGGEGSYGFKHSPETIVKLSQLSNEKWSNPIVREKFCNAQKGRKHSEEHKSKISASAKGHKGCVHTEANKIANGLRKKGNTYRRGITHTEEVRAKMSSSHKGLPLSKERCAAISERLKGNQYTLGFKHSEETKAKMSQRLLGNKNNLGKKMSDETKVKLSAFHKTQIRSPEWCARISASLRARGKLKKESK